MFSVIGLEDVSWCEEVRGARSWGPFWGPLAQKAVPKNDLSNLELVALQLLSLIPRQGLEPRT